VSIALVRTGLPEAAKPALELVTERTVPSLVPSEGRSVPGCSAATTQATSVGAAPAGKPAYPPPAEIMTQEGVRGLRFDFNDGCRATFPESEHPWQICLRDVDTGNVLFQTEFRGGRINSAKRYYVRFRLEVVQQGELVFSHDYDARDREVLIQFPVGTLGDTIGWFPYAVKFKEKHDCRLTCGMAEKLIPLFKDAYPDINFVSHEGIKPEIYYATYSMGLFFDDVACIHQPCDFRQVGLHRTAGYILGVDPTEMRPIIKLEDDSRPILEPYVIVAVQSTTQAKYWNIRTAGTKSSNS
jgi:autotransporter strand-loop-strand O-heptosyltransferase